MSSRKRAGSGPVSDKPYLGENPARFTLLHSPCIKNQGS